MHCEKARDVTLKQSLEGPFVPVHSLDEHLRHCASCQDFLARVDEVDRALQDLPLEAMPLGASRQLLARVAAAGQREESFLPWTLWLPLASLLIGLFWAYVTLVWPSGSDLLRSVDPTVATWLTQFEQWALAQHATLNAVALSVGAGLFFTLLAIGLGLYVGRNRMPASHGRPSWPI